MWDLETIIKMNADPEAEAEKERQRGMTYSRMFNSDCEKGQEQDRGEGKSNTPTDLAA